MRLPKPVDVFDRDTEWDDLAEFATSELPGLRIAVVYGRRRQGKSYLLRRLAEAGGGLYHLATEQTEAISLRRFSEALSGWLELGSALTFEGWESALTSAAELMTRHADAAGAQPLLIIDEFPYLIRESPGLPSIVQALYDSAGPGASSGRQSLSGGQSLRIVLCGSAISVMSDLLSGTKALRGRGALELRVAPFGYRDAREYWGIRDTEAAFLHNALVGGTPGYRELVSTPNVPEQPSRIGQWVARNVLRPSMPLFDEASRVVHEDPRIRDTAVYGSLMAAIASGESSPAKIGGLLGRPSSSLSYQLRMLESAGFIHREQDLLFDRRPVIRVADPLVRLHHLVIEPYLADLEAGHAERVWDEVTHTVASKILGPHLEALARHWVAHYAGEEVGLHVGATGQTTIPCREHRTGHEVDVLALRRGTRPRTAGAGIAFIGEAKARERRPGIGELERLEHVQRLLALNGHEAENAVLGLFSTRGFTDELQAEARKRGGGLLLAGLERLYG